MMKRHTRSEQLQETPEARGRQQNVRMATTAVEIQSKPEDQLSLLSHHILVKLCKIASNIAKPSKESCVCRKA